MARHAKARSGINAAALLVAALAAAPDAGAQAPQTVDLELVLAIDTSASVDSDEFELQRQGLAEAFLDPDVIRAIGAAGEFGVAVSLIQWSGETAQRTVIDWTMVRDRESAARFSNIVRGMPRAVTGMTDTAGAIRYSLAMIDDNAYDGQRRVIDISGDGTSEPVSSQLQRDRAVARGVTVNGLIIYSKDTDLGELARINLRDHYARHVIGGTGAFMMEAADFADFGIAIRRKLVREFAGPETTGFPDSGSVGTAMVLDQSTREPMP